MHIAPCGTLLHTNLVGWAASQLDKRSISFLTHPLPSLAQQTSHDPNPLVSANWLVDKLVKFVQFALAIAQSMSCKSSKATATLDIMVSRQRRGFLAERLRARDEVP